MDIITRRNFCLGTAVGVVAGVLPTASAATAGKRITIEARPRSLTFDTSTAAVLVVDLQNDFLSPGGMFERGGMNVAPIRRILSPTARVLSAARRAGVKVVYLKMGFSPDLSDLGADGSVNRTLHLVGGVGESMTSPDGRASRIMIRDTWNTEVVQEVRPQPGDLQIFKTRFSGFYQTTLHEQLAKHGIRHLIVTGCTTSVCVESTVRDAMFRDYLPIVLSDCTGEVVGSELARTNHDATLLLIAERFGWVTDSASVMSSLGSGQT